MIRSVAQLLQEVMHRETAVLAEINIPHAPTIGDMYEGLSKQILEASIPAELELRIVAGFVSDGSNGLSGEVDCMLVRGDGRAIPYTDKYEWNAPDVLAVFEIKKTLTGKSLADSFEHLKTVRRVEESAIASGKFGDREYRMKLTRLAFSQMTGVIAPSSGAPHSTLTPDQKILLSILTQERISAIRVVIGYDGFKTERGFRQGLINHLESNLTTPGFSPLHFPTLMICGKYSLVKTNGLPYTAILEDHWWPFYASTSVNPLVFLLELLWTRIEADFRVGMPWGDDLDSEVLNACIRSRIQRIGSQTGWEYAYVDAKESALAKTEATEDWSPTELSREQALFFMLLQRDRLLEVGGDQIGSLSRQAGVTREEFVQSLLDTKLTAIQDGVFRAITDEFAVCHMPDGRILAAENSTGRLTRWVSRYHHEGSPARLPPR